MQEVVVDTNLIIDVEERRTHYSSVIKVRDLHDKGVLKINLPAIMASEKKVNGQIVSNYNLFKQYVESIGFTNTIDLRPPMYLGMCYLSYSILGGGEVTKLLNEIHDILFKNKNI